MSDYIKREDAIGAILDKYVDYAGITDAIKAVPSADVVDVVRCKDCKYYHPSYCEIWSKYGTVQTREKGFCYMAERGDSDDDQS